MELFSPVRLERQDVRPVLPAHPSLELLAQIAQLGSIQRELIYPRALLAWLEPFRTRPGHRHASHAQLEDFRARQFLQCVHYVLAEAFRTAHKQLCVSCAQEADSHPLLVQLAVQPACRAR